MAKLPLEVIQIIFTVSLPPRRNNNDRSRFAFLLPLCHIHRSLTRSIQRIIFSNIFLRETEPIRQFLESLELVPECKRWVKTLELQGDGTRNVAEANDALSTVVEHCSEMEEVQLFWFESVNLALLAQLKHLRSLKCSELYLMYNELVVGQSTTFGSLVSLSFVGGSYTDMNRSFLMPEVLPSLRRLSIEFDPHGGGPINSITDLYNIAGQLHHLSLEFAQRLRHRLLHSRLSKPLVGLRLLSDPEVEDGDMVMELLKEALSSGLISASPDSRTVIFHPGVDEEHAEEAGLSQWAESLGLELNTCESALEEEWSRNSLDEGHSEFTQWVDKEAAKREAALQARRIKR